MKKEGYSRPELFGTMKHYDANGNKIGESRPGFFGSMNNYDANGHKVGHSSPGLFGTMNHYDNQEDRDILGTDGRLYDSDFDFDGDGKLNAYEYSVMDDVVFGHEDTDTGEEDELEDDLSLAGLDATDLDYMDADERREALEDAGLDPDDYDFD